MNATEFYNYIKGKCKYDRTASNIIEYVDLQGFVDHEDTQSHLSQLLQGIPGISDEDIKKCEFWE